jgi:hypothetical protein
MTASTIFIGNSVQTQVEELYYAVLGRQPDTAGLVYYSNLVASGASIAQIASYFLAAPEFAANYGTNLSDSQYVTDLYQNVLHRAPSAAELAYYTNGLANYEQGVASATSWSRTQVLLNFVNSPENQKDLAASVFASGGVDTDPSSTSVTVTATGTSGVDIAMAASAAKSITVLGNAHLTLDMFGANYAALTTLTISNSGGVTAYVYNAPALTTINASASSGTNVLSLSSTESYIGGSGQSIVTITADDVSAPLTGGSAANNELVLAGAKFTLAGTGTEATGFSIAGFNFLSTAGAYDVSGDAGTILKGITAVDLQSALPLATTFTVAQGAGLAIEAGSTASILFQSIDKSGASDSMTLTLGTAAGAGATTSSLTLEDSAATPVGIGIVNLVSNGGGAVNTIATLADTALSVLNVSGTDGVAIGSTVFNDDSAAGLTINNVSGGTVTLQNFTDNALTSVTVTGNNGVVLTSLTDTVGSAFILSDSNSSVVDIQAFGVSSAPTITITNSGSGLLVLGDLTGLSSTTLTSLTLNGAVALTLAADTVTSGTTISAASDNAPISIYIAGSAAGDTDTITLGSGADYVKTAGSGTENITLGNGGTPALPNRVDLTGSTAVDNVIVGTGMNNVILGDGSAQERVGFGQHAATATFYDEVTLTNVNASFATATASTATSVPTTSLYVMSGLHAGDKILLPLSTDTLALAANLAGANGAALLAHGTYNASAGTFTYAASGADTLLTFDTVNTSTHTFSSVVLVGFAATAASSMAYDGTITLG